MSNNSTLLYFIISIFLFLTCNEIDNKNTDNKEKDLENRFNIEFVKIIDEFIDSVEANWELKPLLGIENFYYTAKFFELGGNVFFTIRTSHTFPSYEYFNNTFYKNDTTCMYYFKIHNRNLIIIDYPDSKGHDVYSKNTESNSMAIEEKRRNSFTLKKESIRPSNPTIYRKTFKVNKTIDGVKLSKLDSVILVPPYDVDSHDYIQIIEDD